MADSKKGKSGLHQYAAQGKGGRLQIYCSKSSRYVTLLEMHTVLKSSKARVYNSAGKDCTKDVKTRAKAEFKKYEGAKRAREKAEREMQKRIAQEAGYYCDCKLSNTFKSVSAMLNSNTDIKPSELGKPVKTILNSKKLCAFCNYEPTYYKLNPRTERRRVDKRSRV